MRLPTAPKSILLDFDGVIVDSVAIKSRGFQYSYPEANAEQLAQIDAYHHAHGGISRREKFRHFEANLFGREPTAERIEALSARYRSAVYERVTVCDFIDGAQDFLATAAPQLSLHLISGTPEDELQAIVAFRGLERYFGAVIGAPTAKKDAFKSLCERDGIAPGEAVAVGDSTTEYDAACELGIPFVAIVAPGQVSAFPESVPSLPDLTGLAALLGLAQR